MSSSHPAKPRESSFLSDSERHFGKPAARKSRPRTLTLRACASLMLTLSPNRNPSKRDHEIRTSMDVTVGSRLDRNVVQLPEIHRPRYSDEVPQCIRRPATHDLLLACLLRSLQSGVSRDVVPNAESRSHLLVARREIRTKLAAAEISHRCRRLLRLEPVHVPDRIAAGRLPG